MADGGAVPPDGGRRAGEPAGAAPAPGRRGRAVGASTCEKVLLPGVPACGWSTATALPRTRRSPAVTGCEGPRRFAGPVPIGRPIANTRAVRARRRGSSRCRWEPWASCTSAATGWRAATSDRPELTAERFVPDPLADLGESRGRGSTAPATWRGVCRTAAGVPRPRRPAGQDPRLPHRAGGDRGGARAPTRRCARRRSWRARTCRASKRLVAYVVPRRGSPARAARPSRARGCPTTWCRRPSSCCRRCRWTPNGKVDRRALPAPERRRHGRAVDGAAHPGRGAAGRDLVGGAAGRAGRRPRRLLRPRRALAAGHAGGLAVARDLRRRAAAAPAVRGADGRRAGAAGARRRSAPERARPRRRSSPVPRLAAARSPSPRSGSGSSIGWSRAAAAYNVPLALRLRGRLDAAALGAALGEIVRAPRGAAHQLPRRGPRGSLQVIAPPPPAVAAGRRSGGAARRRGRGAPARPARRRRRPFDLSAGSAAALPRCCGWAARTHIAAADDAPHRLRRLVAGGLAAGAVGALRGVLGRPAVAAAGAADPVRRLRDLAARVAARGDAGDASSPSGASASPERRRCSSCRSTGRGRRCRPRAARGCRCAWTRRTGGGSAPLSAGGGARPCSWCCSPPSRPCSPATTASDDVAGRHADRQPQPRRDRGADRLLRQHPGAARPTWRASRASPTLLGGCGRRPSAPTRTRTCRSRSWSRSCGRSGHRRTRRCSR